MSFVAQISNTGMAGDVAHARAQPKNARGQLAFEGAQPEVDRIARLDAFLSKQAPTLRDRHKVPKRVAMRLIGEAPDRRTGG